MSIHARKRTAALLAVTSAVAALVTANPVTQAAGASPIAKPVFTDAVAHDLSPSLALLAAQSRATKQTASPLAAERGPLPSGSDQFSGDAARQTAGATALVGPTIQNFEGAASQDNFNVFGFRVNPPDPNGEVGPNHYVETVNLTFSIYSKTGTALVPPTAIGALWKGFAVADCTDPSGDPVVLYDQFMDRWLLSQFTTRGPEYFNCVAISATSDPTGAYYRYAFSTGLNFPDYPKYGNWTDSYVITTREFGPTNEYGIGVYGLEKNKMVNGQPARMVRFFLDGNNPTILPLVGDGLLPADVDGNTKPRTDAAIPLVGSQDDNWVYGATSDALNVWNLSVKWRATPIASIAFASQLPVASFDSDFPCKPGSRDCLPQPAITNPHQYLDILSYRQRPTWRLAYRNWGTYESLVTNQSVEALPGIAGMRWYELRRTGSSYSVFQQGTYAPNDGVHRWMGSVAQDKRGNMAAGYSVVNATTVYPGIRYSGRTAGAALGTFDLGEGVIVNGSGVQTTTNSRWGDYTSMTVDPVDDCTFWYVNEYYTAAGQASSRAGWQTRIASFKLPGC